MKYKIWCRSHAACGVIIREAPEQAYSGVTQGSPIRKLKPSTTDLYKVNKSPIAALHKINLVIRTDPKNKKVQNISPAGLPMQMSVYWTH